MVHIHYQTLFNNPLKKQYKSSDAKQQQPLGGQKHCMLPAQKYVWVTRPKHFYIQFLNNSGYI